MSMRPFHVLSLGMLALAAALLFAWGQGGVVRSSGAAEDPLQEEKGTYVGVAGCGCHQKEELGQQFQIWTGARHARSFLSLRTGYIEMIPEEAHGMVDRGRGRAVAQEAKRLKEDTHCLSCHTTASADTALWESTFHIEDGVQCEACHGPAGGHVAKMTRRTSWPSDTEEWNKDLVKKDCMICHREKPSHAILRGKPFDREKAWKKIAHPIPEK